MVYVTSHISGERQTWSILHKELSPTGLQILETVQDKEGCNSDICLWLRGRYITPSDKLNKDDTLVATLRLRGGKGGFGSMLRAIGAQIEKTTNREACRDLSGRRLRDINEEKRLKDFLSKKAEKEREALELKKKKLAKLKEQPKHYFEDKTYMEQREKNEQDIFDSVDKAFSNDDLGSTSGLKRPLKNEDSKEPIKKKKKMLDDLDESSSDESDAENQRSS